MQEENRSNDIVPQGDVTPVEVTRSRDAVPSDPGSFPHPPAALRPGLTPVQEVAMQRLIAGSSIQQAARAAQVDRRTLSRWLHNDPHFASAYAAWQREMVASGRARVLAMTDIALDAVQRAILQGDGRVALQVAKATGALDAPKPGTTDPAWFGHRQKLRDNARQSELRSAEFQEGLKRQRDPTRRVAYCEDIVDTYVRHLYDALRAEPPDARTARLADQPKRHRAYHPMTVRLLNTIADDAPLAPSADSPDPRPAPAATHEPVDGTVVAASTAAPPPPAPASSSPASSVAENVDAPPPSPIPRAEPAAFQGPRAVSSKSIDPPPAEPRHRPPPVIAVRYDGSDEMDNEPGWVKLV